MFFDKHQRTIVNYKQFPKDCITDWYGNCGGITNLVERRNKK